MSRTTNIPRRAQVVAYAAALAVLAANALLIQREGVDDLVPALILGALAVAFQMTRQRLSRITEVSLCDLPLIVAILTIDPGMAMLVGVSVGVVPRGRFGNTSRAMNVCAFAIPTGVAALLFALLRDVLAAGTPEMGAGGWFIAAVTVVAVHVGLHCVVVDMWGWVAYGYPFLQNIRENGLPIAKYDVVSGVVTATLVEIALLLDGLARLLPVIVGLVAVGGLWLFLSATRKQLESQELKDEFFRAIFVSFARLLEMKDPDTAYHSARVAIYSRDIAQQMGLSAEDQSRVHLAGLLHDVGKVGVPDEILLKPGRLTDEERRIMQRHARLSAEALQGIPGFGDLVRMIYAHHERLDGSGYPEGTGGPDLPLGARILGVADTFEALTSRRPYRPGRPATEALLVFEEDSHLFDDEVVEALRHLVAADSTSYTFGKITDFSDEWSRAAKYLDVRLDEEPFVVPAEPEPFPDYTRVPEPAPVAGPGAGPPAAVTAENGATPATARNVPSGVA